ncbi:MULTISPECIES: CoA-binding protein [Streptococcus]|uniref:CoA-binding protein n=1 Tax=Streptococcus caledonicus TaxID=2614158 RepID=A0ABW0UBN4_9STRE|nr:CoA-binding protein [Streptococcus sp. S784/96/1]
MTYHFQNPNDITIKKYLKESKTIAIVGLSNRQETAAYRVASYLKDAGYTIIPVNPKLAGSTVLGERAYASLQDVPVHINIVDVFRRSDFLPDVAKDFLDTDADIFWAQLGLENQEAEILLRSAGRHNIVMNRCIKIDHAELS